MDLKQYAEALRQRTALAKGLKRLYRFQKYDSARLALLLSTRVMRASNPRYFNDPFDCRPMFDLATLERPGAVDGFLEFIRKVVVANNPDLAGKFESDSKQIRERSELRAGAMSSMSREAAKQVFQNHRIVCFGTSPSSSLLWSHYGDGQRGVCIEVDTHKRPFSSALEVSYKDAFPQLDFSGGFPEAFAELTLLTKSSCWKYEDEYRVITSEIDGTMFERTHNDFLELPEGAVTGIYLGQQIDRRHVEEVAYLIRRFSPKTKLSVLARDGSSYDLKVIEVSPGQPSAVQAANPAK